MAKRVFQLEYSYGNARLAAHITKMSADRYIAFLTRREREIDRIDLTKAEYDELLSELWARCDGPPEYDFGSIWPLRNFICTGNLDREPDQY
jgi:hypothetical protein